MWSVQRVTFSCCKFKTWKMELLTSTQTGTKWEYWHRTPHPEEDYNISEETKDSRRAFTSSQTKLTCTEKASSHINGINQDSVYQMVLGKTKHRWQLHCLLSCAKRGRMQTPRILLTQQRCSALHCFTFCSQILFLKIFENPNRNKLVLDSSWLCVDTQWTKLWKIS